MLSEDGVILNENKFLLNSLTKASRLKNDKVQTRFPIQKGVLKILLKNTRNYFFDRGQYYLERKHKALFVSAYFGLLRVGELTVGPHAILAKNVHVGENKNKVLFILESSKTHGKDRKPQLVKISSRTIEGKTCSTPRVHHNQDSDNICAYSIISDYLKTRPKAKRREREQFFVFADGSPVYPVR